MTVSETRVGQTRYTEFRTLPSIVFEAHSTDYQGTGPISELVEGVFAILKVGPELTFVLREALYALHLIATDLVPGYGDRPLQKQMELVMLADARHWEHHYSGDDATRRMLRHYSLSDRIRYYWTYPGAQDAVQRLFSARDGVTVPLPLMWQYLPGAQSFADHPLTPEDAMIWRVTQGIQSYHAGCRA